MVDIARLGIEVNATQPQQAADALGRLTAAGARAEGAAQRVGAASRAAGGSLAGLSRATAAAATHASGAAASVEGLGLAAGSAAQRAEAAATFMGRFAASTTAAGAAASRAGAGLKGAGAAALGAGKEVQGAARHTANLAAQFNDIGVQLAAGQSPLLLAVQQGTQINQVLATMGTRGGALKALGAAFTSIVSPVSLLTIGLIAGGAALAQWGIRAVSANRETRSFSDILDDLADKTDAYADAADNLLLSIDDQVMAYGDLAEEMREVTKLQAQLAQLSAQEALDKTAAALANVTNQGLLANPVLQDFINLVRGGDSFASLFAIPADEVYRVEQMQEQFEAINKSIRESAGNAEAQNRHIRAMITLATTLAEEWGGISNREAEYLSNLATAADQSARQVVTLKEMTITGTKRLEISKSDATWIERTLRLLRQQQAEAATIAEHGRDSVEFREQQAQAAREALQADIESRKITEETADNLRGALASQQAAREAADNRIQADREALRVAQEQEQIAERLAQIDLQRQHAEASIAQRLQNRIEVARAIVVYGADSVQAKLAEEAVSRRLFELDLQRHGIQGDMYAQLVAQYQAAAQLEGQIVAAQPAFQGLNSTIGSIANAWGEFVVGGFQDFKEFGKKVIDSFKQLLVQMIATAAKNRIMIGLGIGGAAGGAGMGGLLGGGGGGGGLGSIFSMFGGGGGGGGLGGFFSGPFGGGFKNAAFNLGLIHGPAVAGGGAAALASGAAGSAAFGFGPAAGIGAGGLGAGGGTMAAGGLTALGGIGLAVGAGALLFAALRTKTKVLDSGIQVAIDGADVLVEGFQKIQKSKFFGLSRRTSSRGSPIDEEEAGPIRDAVAVIRAEMLGAADALNLGSESLEKFRTTVQISLHGLSESEQQAKITESLGSVGNEMARLALAAGGLDVPLHKAGDRLGALATSLTVVNEALGVLGHRDLGEGVFGGGALPVGMEIPTAPDEFTLQPTRTLGGRFGSRTEATPRYEEALADYEQELRIYNERMKAFDSFIERQTEAHGGGALAAEDLIARFGGADAFQTAADAFFQTFHTEAERMDALRESITGTLGELNTELPESMDAFRALVEAQSLSTESGRELYAALLQVAPQFATLSEYEKQLAAARGEGAISAEQAIENERRLAEARAEFEARARGMVQSITDTPIEALARQRDALLTEAQELEASTDAITEWYQLQAQAITDEATARDDAIRAAEEAQTQATQEAERQAREAFEGRAESMLQGVTDSPLVALFRQFSALAAEAEALGASTDAITEWYLIQDQAIRDQSNALEAANQAANEAVRVGFEAQALRMLQQATDTPLEAITRQRDALLTEAEALGATTDAIVQWYEFQVQAIADQAAAQAEAQRQIESAQRQREAATFEGFRRTFIPEAELIAEQRKALEDAGVDISRTGFRRQVETTPEGEARNTLLEHASALQEVLVYEERLAEQRRREGVAAAQAAAQAAQQRQAELERQVDGFYRTFYSNEERVANARRELSASFSALGIALPNTRQAFRDLVEEAAPGSSLFNSLIGLADQFAFITDGADNLNETLGATQQIFRDLREEAIVRGAQPSADSQGARVDADSALIRELIAAVNNGTVRTVRELEDTRREMERNNIRPTRQTL